MHRIVSNRVASIAGGVLSHVRGQREVFFFLPRTRTIPPATQATIGVSNSHCEHSIASTASFFASTSSDQICLASNEHSRKYNWRTAKTSPNHKFYTLVY